MACHIRKNDMVIVVSGVHKGARGKVLRVDRKRGRVVVEGVRMVYRHVRPTRKNPQGGRLQKEAPLDISNVLPFDSGSGKGTRVRFELERDGRGRISGKRRVARRSGVTLHTLRTVKG
ncbi:MAG: 50S ribosomal protein L24 [Phycisphaerales bacterium]|nr:MAG: 50S ribosomal protein L24 [Phycisphaerales bacterium]